MVFEPKDVVRKLEFDKVLDLLSREALTGMAAEMLAELAPHTNFDQIDSSLRQAREFKLAL